MIFDYTLTLGSLLQTITIVCTVASLYWAVRSDVKILKHDIENLRDGQKSLVIAFEHMGKVLTQVAVQDTRISMIEKDIDELRHGQGLVVKTNR